MVGQHNFLETVCMIKPQLTNYKLWAMYVEVKPGQETKEQSKHTQEIVYKWKEHAMAKVSISTVKG